jgi:alkylated DNA repair protein (DNA oxidative demethylase)
MKAQREVTLDLFQAEEEEQNQGFREELGVGAVILRGFALGDGAALLGTLEGIADESPFRHMITPGGFRMSVALTNCGSCGWVTNRSGYRYDPIDPESSRRWPCMPELFLRLAENAAEAAGFEDFSPDACLINRYAPGARVSLHQDKNERDFSAPIVTVSLGVPAIFLWGGPRREDRVERIQLKHGDVMVWGGPSRLCYHGVSPIKENYHQLTGNNRISLTFRKAL